MKAHEDQAPAAEAIMDGAMPIDRDARLMDYRNEGWSRFDERGEPYRPII